MSAVPATGSPARPAYDRAFFDFVDSTSRTSARVVVPMVLQLTGARSVVDVGCGEGVWLAACREAGVEDILGLDGDYVDRASLAIPGDRFRAHDLLQPLALERRFDLAMCLEVGEHLPERCAPALVESLTGLSPVVLFSAAVPGQGGHNHLNEQWQDYWARLFLARGYRTIDAVRPQIWERSEVSWWYRQNVLLYASDGWIADHPAVSSWTSHPTPVRLVHPENLDAKVEGLYEQGRIIRDLRQGAIKRAAKNVLAKLGLRKSP